MDVGAHAFGARRKQRAVAEDEIEGKRDWVGKTCQKLGTFGASEPEVRAFKKEVSSCALRRKAVVAFRGVTLIDKMKSGEAKGYAKTQSGARAHQRFVVMGEVKRKVKSGFDVKSRSRTGRRK